MEEAEKTERPRLWDLAGAWRGVGIAVGIFALTRIAQLIILGWLDAAVGSAQPLLQISLVAAVTGSIGLIRFAALRWIFRPTGALTAR